jgi:hypothetical protein
MTPDSLQAIEYQNSKSSWYKQMAWAEYR